LWRWGKSKIDNGIYQANQTNLKDYKIAKTGQDRELIQIEQSCAEHAIISLVTAFETYYKELIQQLFADYPDYFTSKNTIYSSKIKELLQSDQLFNYEDIDRKLDLRNRLDYYNFLEAYSILFFSDEEKEMIEYLYLRRNNFVHNAGRPDTKLQTKLAKTPSPVNESVISTEAKRLRTKFGKTLSKSYNRIIADINGTAMS
jgi:hypothetical protein